ncbi:MAG TPA: ferredoxin [bacterium]|nr:ferredoxin [bacterium]HPL95249.1 ferredoxin [bacterium]
MLKINPEKCIGCGLCSTICPHVFKLNSKTGKSEVISQDSTDCDLNKAIDSCPTGAITEE